MCLSNVHNSESFPELQKFMLNPEELFNGLKDLVRSASILEPFDKFVKLCLQLHDHRPDYNELMDTSVYKSFKKNREFDDENIVVKAFGSLGVSFITLCFLYVLNCQI